VRDGFDRLLQETTLVAVALGLALGLTLLEVVEGLTTFVERLLEDYPPSELDTLTEAEPFMWEVGGRLLELDPLVYALMEFGLALLVAILVMRRRRAVR
jgi:hypothetical protein